MKPFCLAFCGALTFVVAEAAQETTASKAPQRFAKPVRLKAAEKLMGEARYFPSPVFHDVNGDGHLDLVIGDLMGLMTVALRIPGDGPARYGAEERLKGADGKDLKFNNW